MIVALICKCPSAETTLYKFLQNYTDQWMDIPIYTGRKECDKFLSQMTSYPMGEKSPYELGKFKEKVSRYIVIAGFDEKEFQWADIAHKDAKSMMDAELILERFA